MGEIKTKTRKSVETVILKNMGSSDKKRYPSCRKATVATTLLSRDYKGLSNFASNGVVEVSRL